MTNEQLYLSLLQRVMREGTDRADRTGTGVRSLFGVQTTFDIRNSFPLLTTKKMNLASIASELLWFIEGSGDERRLAEIRFGKPRDELTAKQTIWTANAQADYWKSKAKFEGDLGRVYGVQWRKWKPAAVSYNSVAELSALMGPEARGTFTSNPGMAGGTSAFFGQYFPPEVDQLANLIEGIKNDPFGRRHILTAWNPGELDQMALPPCHVMCQFYVSGRELSCLLYQRSNDLFLGSPYNIASYAMLTMMIAQVCGLKPGDFIYSQGDVHIYHNHFDAVHGAAIARYSRRARPLHGTRHQTLQPILIGSRVRPCGRPFQPMTSATSGNSPKDGHDYAHCSRRPEWRHRQPEHDSVASSG
jgi:thymidylate synthase